MSSKAAFHSSYAATLRVKNVGLTPEEQKLLDEVMAEKPRVKRIKKHSKRKPPTVQPASITAPLASEATQRNIDRKRRANTNHAMDDSMTGTDRAGHLKRVVGKKGCTNRVQEANMSASYNDSHSMTCPVTGLSLDPCSVYTRPLRYYAPRKLWGMLSAWRDYMRCIEAKRSRYYSHKVVTPRKNPRHMLTLLDSSNGADFVIARGSDGYLQIIRLYPDGRRAEVMGR